MKKLPWILRLQYYCLVILALIVPLNRRLFPPVFALYVILSLCEGKFRSKLHRIKERKLLPVFVGYVVMYSAYLIGLLWSHNYPFAYKDLLLKLPFLLLPLCLFTLDDRLFNPSKLFTLLYAFIAGCFIYTLYVFVVWIFKVGVNGFWSSFRISASGFVAHHSYISMCYTMAIAIIIYVLSRKHLPVLLNLSLIVAALLFVFQIIVLSSRTAWIASAALLILAFIYMTIQTIRRRLKPLFVLLFTFLFLITAVFVWSIPAANNRCLQTIHRVKYVGSLSAADIRWEIWKCSFDVIKEHPIRGTGTGDVRDSLTEKQMEAGIPSFNAHNQFLNTWISSGLLGLLSFLTILALSLVRAIQTHSFLYLVFLIIITINCMTESIFEKQMGLLFFVFFNSYLYLYTPMQLQSAPPPKIQKYTSESSV